MPTALIVTRPFGKYGVGDRIIDADTIAQILSSTNHGNVVAVNGAATPSPVPPAPVGLTG